MDHPRAAHPGYPVLGNTVRAVADEFVFPEPWQDLRGHGLEEESRRRFIEGELRREVAAGHLLFGTEVRAVASCLHCDDALFALPDGRFAKVHLSYPKGGSDRPPWPATLEFDAWTEATSYVVEHAESTGPL